MFSRQNQEQTQASSSSQSLRSTASFKHRFGLDDDDEKGQTAQPPSSKRRSVTFAPFFGPGSGRGDDKSYDNGYFSDAGRRHHRRRRSSTPESPIVENLQGACNPSHPSPFIPWIFVERLIPTLPNLTAKAANYSNLRTSLHSTALTDLESAQEVLTTEATSKIKSNREALAKLECAYGKLVAPISQVTVKEDYVADSPAGSPRDAVMVDMSTAVPEFEARVSATVKELDTLWAS
ncbi:uncharacterized protein BCR38DRAFT_137565 [Pseudomassariella vexata]|uniref:Uncharacterized protein n=1 Tax=Pseudomassariella vexata TaxID=1141098 RepID=A0A1Y2EBP2_9PEZI|nr:uncharacterized protein BCR38DRAFT_137565 [Pseudomassariella vexata]ORY68724.1 hypothetical protein BCR38DRAFT_137565 [Pseudomassariella vexata]